MLASTMKQTLGLEMSASVFLGVGIGWWARRLQHVGDRELASTVSKEKNSHYLEKQKKKWTNFF